MEKKIHYLLKWAKDEHINLGDFFNITIDNSNRIQLMAYETDKLFDRFGGKEKFSHVEGETMWDFTTQGKYEIRITLCTK